MKILYRTFLKEDLNNEIFDENFEKRKSLAAKINVMLTMSRNATDPNKKSYWKSTVFNPRISAIINDLSSRSGKTIEKLMQIEKIQPGKLDQVTRDELYQIANSFKSVFESEFEMTEDICESLSNEIR